MGSVVSGMYQGVQYMLGCGGNSAHALMSPEMAASGGTPFIWKRTGSMYFDEDGDLAHEFYEEVRPEVKGEKAWMRPKTTRLSPQGMVDHPYPRLNVDFPVVMCEAWTKR
ncbi:predicted protein [Nematostella vectensis]|uniref:Uncharacterized protein n=1 Tax=Nematostella vectensis TaxID=45351 RepID=A7S3I4_NEMVE|nr:tumor suppressor candidate 2 [Nematostella vectensis]EDO41776.1 predicted protein [Nematostella vectensis]|eukprot:XP_001633839.1 predicted protein [Nematostella vectensis]